MPLNSYFNCVITVSPEKRFLWGYFFNKNLIQFLLYIPLLGY